MSSNPIQKSSKTAKFVPKNATANSGIIISSKGVIGPSAPDARKMNSRNAKGAAHTYGAINRLRMLASLHRIQLPQSSLIRLMDYDRRCQT